MILFVSGMIYFVSGTMIIFSQGGAAKTKSRQFSEFGFRTTVHCIKVQMKCFFIAEFERAAKLRKIAVYSFLISFLVPEL